MEQALNEKLLNELRERVSELLAATQLMSGLVREQGDEKDRKCLAVMNHSLYRMLRTIGHMELCREDTPFSPQVVDLAGLCRDLGREMERQAKELGVRFRWERPIPGGRKAASKRRFEPADKCVSGGGAGGPCDFEMCCRQRPV